MKKWMVCGFGMLCVLILTVSYMEKEIPALAEISGMTDQKATEALAGASRQALLDAWGEPSGMLSGLYGDIYETPEGRYVVIYYDVRLDSGPRVQSVKIDR